MMATPFGSTTLIGINIQKCRHAEEKKIIINERNSTLVDDLFHKFHPFDHKTSTYSLKCGPDIGTAEGLFEVQCGAGITIGELTQSFKVKSFIFAPECDTVVEDVLRDVCTEAIRKAVNAFELLMAGGKAFPDRKTERLYPLCEYQTPV